MSNLHKLSHTHNTHIHTHTQVLAMNLVLLVGVLFAGFLANKESIPLPLRWITYLSVFRCSGGRHPLLL